MIVTVRRLIEFLNVIRKLGKSYRNIVILINGSEASIHAAQYGILLSKLYRCNLKAVYVVDTASLKQLTLSKFFVADESAMYEENLQNDGKRYLDYVAELGKAKGVKDAHFAPIFARTRALCAQNI